MCVGVYYKLSPTFHPSFYPCPLLYNFLESHGQGDPSHSWMLESIKIIHVLTLSCGLCDVSGCPISRHSQWACTVKPVLLLLGHLHGNVPRLAREWETYEPEQKLSKPRSASWQLGKPQTCAQAQPRSAKPPCQPPADPNAWTINTVTCPWDFVVICYQAVFWQWTADTICQHCADK